MEKIKIEKLKGKKFKTIKSIQEETVYNYDDLKKQKEELEDRLKMINKILNAYETDNNN